MRKQLLFLESNSTGTGMKAIRTASEWGFLPVLLTNDPLRYRDLDIQICEVVTCDTNDYETVSHIVEARHDAGELAGLLTTSDFYLEPVAQLAAQFGFPGSSPGAIRACRNKWLTRQKLREIGIPQPAFVAVHSPAEVISAVRAVGLPCVVKPIDDSGSNEVRLCRTLEEAERQAARVFGATFNVRGQLASRTALIEQFIDAPEYSVEMFAWQGELHCIGITEKQTMGDPFFVESAHLFPAPLSESKAVEIRATVRRALRHIGVIHGATHTEVKWTKEGCVLIEVNPRLAGGMIPEIIKLASGIDLIEAQLQAALGMAPELSPRRYGYGSIGFIMAEEDGRLLASGGVEDAACVQGVSQLVMHAKPGQPIRKPQNAYDRLGYIIAEGATPGKVSSSVQAAVSKIKLEIEQLEGVSR
ncbi:ATP-grasp domain-containing protein [Gorillibacterium massiliense]|uniref:ATP-grasp domain-containing protein n=1 Tax=Gorillibacterium massiliense TaxID=1280390 RepID=UPI0004B7DC36|nr:ATP-grasp domain-containing protein [Gorillibacterium massiliense]